MVLGQHDGQKAILNAIVGENVGEGWGNHGAKTKISQSPHGMFARRSAAKVFASNQDAGAFVAGLVEHKRWVLVTAILASPIEKEELPKTSSLDALQKLFGDDLIGVHVSPIQGSDYAGMYAKRVHCVVCANTVVRAFDVSSLPGGFSREESALIFLSETANSEHR